MGMASNALAALLKRSRPAVAVLVSLGLISAGLWLIAKEWRRERELQSSAEFIRTATALNKPEHRASLLAELIDAQKRAQLPLAIDAPQKLEDLTKRLRILSTSVGQRSDQIADVVVTAGSDSTPLEVPSASFTQFRYIPHTISFVGAGEKDSAPYYSFVREFGGGVFPPENLNHVRKGQIFGGWKIVGAETPKIPGKFVKVKVGERKGEPVFADRQLPSFSIYRLHVRSEDSGQTTILSAPKSDQDAERAKQSGFPFSESLEGKTPSAEITLKIPGSAPEVLTVKESESFKFLEKTYRVMSIQSGKIELLEAPTDQEVIWGLTRDP